jgi:hypothetical protein
MNNMQEFILASVSPRSIAWLVRPNDWKRLEVIIKYNSAMRGGYYNVILPVTDRGELSDIHRRFLIEYDPDLVVLAQGMEATSLDPVMEQIHPFGIINWTAVSGIATLDPWASGSGLNPSMGLMRDPSLIKNAFAAVANVAFPDTSRLALVACGDIQPRTPMLTSMDEDLHLDANGYRESFLEQLLAPGHDRDSVRSHIDESGEIVPAPDRFELERLIEDGSKFPLQGAVEILNTCYSLQRLYIARSFITLTTNGLGENYRDNTYSSLTTTDRIRKQTSNVIIIVSDSFGIEEATLFWNLRASRQLVAWLSFIELEGSLDDVTAWLDSDYGGIYYTFVSSGSGSEIIFSSPIDQLPRLQRIVDEMKERRSTQFLEFLDWQVLPAEQLIVYEFERPYSIYERVIVSHQDSKCTLIPRLPQDLGTGNYAITLEWDELMLPPSKKLIDELVSPSTTIAFSPRNIVTMPTFRCTKSRYISIQTSDTSPIQFNKPAPDQTIELLLTGADFSRLERSSAGRYHVNFVERAGGLEQASIYLATSPYRDLFDLLSDNTNNNKRGWILEHPSKRRTLHHLDLCEVLKKPIPSNTQSYFDKSADELPLEASELITKGLLERGFLLRCSFCSFNSWYPIESITNEFRCARCSQVQMYRSNPMWLYKLPEVVFQGLEGDNMHVPLLALNYLNSTRSKHFSWRPDSNIYWQNDQGEVSKNIDILCLRDGKLYIGEAKSSDSITADQFAFYEELASQAPVDGVVFATSAADWKPGTVRRIEEMEKTFRGEIIILTHDHLYSRTGIPC